MKNSERLLTCLFASLIWGLETLVVLHTYMGARKDFVYYVYTELEASLRGGQGIHSLLGRGICHHL